MTTMNVFILHSLCINFFSFPQLKTIYNIVNRYAVIIFGSTLFLTYTYDYLFGTRDAFIINFVLLFGTLHAFIINFVLFVYSMQKSC